MVLHNVADRELQERCQFIRDSSREMAPLAEKRGRSRPPHRARRKTSPPHRVTGEGFLRKQTAKMFHVKHFSQNPPHRRNPSPFSQSRKSDALHGTPGPAPPYLIALNSRRRTLSSWVKPFAIIARSRGWRFKRAEISRSKSPRSNPRTRLPPASQFRPSQARTR